MNSRSLVVGVVGALALAILIIPNVAGAAQDKQDVRVVNTATEPVPVTGNVSITGTPTVNIGGTPAVSVSGTPDVRVANSASEPVPVVVAPSGAGTTPFQFHAQFEFGGVAGGTRSDSVAFSVPADKRLTIEYVTFSDLSRPVGVETVSIQTRGGSEFHISHFFAVMTNGNSDSISQPATIYADPGTSAFFFVRLTEPIGGEFSTEFMHGSIVGTLTDA